MSENKRKPGKKTTAFLALAAALLASNAVSVMAAAEETSGSDFVQNPDLTDVKYTGGTPAFTKINDNVFVQHARQRRSRSTMTHSTKSRTSVCTPEPLLSTTSRATRASALPARSTRTTIAYIACRR